MNEGDPTSAFFTKAYWRESDMPIVVLISGKVKPEGAKGHYCKQIFLK